MSLQLAGHWRCGLCRDVYETEGQADFCCGYLKAIDSDPMLLDAVDRREATMEAELEQARKRVAELQRMLMFQGRHFVDCAETPGACSCGLSQAIGSAFVPGHGLVESKAEAALRKWQDLGEIAWGVIANAGGGDWKLERTDWQEAAARWRDDYHALLAAAREVLGG